VRGIVRLLPSTALTDALHGALDPSTTVPTRIWPILVLWAAAGIATATSLFRWDPDR
jgi:hypothetical protein